MCKNGDDKMPSRALRNSNKDTLDIEVIRYFLNNENEYLIYSLNENDEVGYTKLYASKIVGNTARIIADEEEWQLIKEIIKDVVKCNRDGSPLNIKDLDESNLDSITLQDTRVFKLQGNLVNLLAENKQIEQEALIEEEEIIEDEIAEVDEEADFETLYEIEVTKNKQLEEQITELQERIVAYETKFEALKSLIEE